MNHLRRFGRVSLVASILCCSSAALGVRAQDVGESSAPDAGAPIASDAAVEPVLDAAPVAEPAPVVEQAPAALEDAAVQPDAQLEVDAAPLVEPGPVPAISPEPLTLEASEPASPTARAPEAIEVTVVGTRLSRTAGSAHVIRKKDLERFESDDPTKVLLAVPGVYIRGEDGMGLRPNISIRGVDPDRSKKVTLLEDGLLFAPSPYSAPADYYFPVITRMEKVKVTKGPGTIAYGPQTVGGTIDLTTRSIPAQTSGAADVAVGQYGYGKAHVYAGSSTEQVGFLIEGVRLQNSGFKELPGGGDTGYARNEWMVKGSYIVDPRARIKNELRLKLTYSDEVSNETYLGLTDADFRANPDRRYQASQLDRMDNHRIAGVLTHQLDITPKLSLTTHLYRQEFRRTWNKVNGLGGGPTLLATALGNPGSYGHQIDLLQGRDSSFDTTDTIVIGPNKRDFVAQGIESRLRWDAQTGEIEHRLEVGARYHYDSIRRHHSENDYVVVDGALRPEAEGTTVWAYNKAASHAVAMHAIYAGTWRGLTITPGLRSELIRSSDNDQLGNDKTTRFAGVLLPGAGAYYAITKQLGVLAGVYQGFSPPAPGSPKSEKPEKSVNYEAGARFTMDKLWLEAIGFYNDYSNMTSICTASTSCAGDDFDRQLSLGALRIYGVEVLGDHEIPVGAFKVPLSLAYTFTDTEFLTETKTTVGSALPGDPMMYIPHHQLRATAGLEHARGGANVAFTYVGEAREQPRPGPHTDEQFITDLSAFAKVWKTISLYATLNNLFDSRYIVARRPFGARPNAPRWLQVGVKGSF